MRLQILKRDKLFIVLRNLLVSEVFVYLVFLGLALSADWGEIYEGVVLARYVRFEIIEFLFLGISQAGLIILVFIRSLIKENNINDMLKLGEHDKLEFKASLRWDIKRNQVNKELEKTIMKTVAAFLNSEGGCLLIGIDDSGEPVGLENDFATLAKPGADGFENHFNNLFNSMIGPEFRQFVKLSFNDINNKAVCLANVEPSHKPVYLKTENGENFYIRTGNVTSPLKMSEVATYISSWWSK
ncbi:MAG: ATP-binding protein [Patescibacteria group bacterium]